MGIPLLVQAAACRLLLVRQRPFINQRSSRLFVAKAWNKPWRMALVGCRIHRDVVSRGSISMFLAVGPKLDAVVRSPRLNKAYRLRAKTNGAKPTHRLASLDPIRAPGRDLGQ